MSYHGIPIRLVPTDPETHEPLGNFETAVFATIRRCPALDHHLTEFNRLDIAEDAARAKAILARRELINAETTEAVDAAEAKAQEATANLHKISMALADTIHEFLLCGFKGAGYNDEQAERYAAMVEPDRLQHMKSAAALGSGRLDFTTAPQPPAA